MPKEMHLAARSSSGDMIAYHENPYPPADVVELFERHCPGSAKQLLEMAKADQDNAHALEMRKANQSTLRTWLGFLLVVVFVCAMVFLMYTGHWVSGAASLFMALVALAGTLSCGVPPKR